MLCGRIALDHASSGVPLTHLLADSHCAVKGVPETAKGCVLGIEFIAVKLLAWMLCVVADEVEPSRILGDDADGGDEGAHQAEKQQGFLEIVTFPR